MRIYAAILPFVVCLVSCKSTPEKVRANKEKFIQVAKENSKPVVLTDLSAVYEQAKTSHVEGKMKYLGVDNMYTVFSIEKGSGVKLDSVVVFNKSDYKIIYDFAIIGRSIDSMKQKSGLTDFEKVDERLYIGHK